jgi:hypothetical protein
MKKLTNEYYGGILEGSSEIDFSIGNYFLQDFETYQ